MTNANKVKKNVVENNNNSMENTMKVETIFFTNDQGQHEVNTIISNENEMIIVGSIFKKDLKGIARSFIDFEITAEDPEVALEREEALENTFCECQNKGMTLISDVIEKTFGLKVDLNGERQACREAIRGPKKDKEDKNVAKSEEKNKKVEEVAKSEEKNKKVEEVAKNEEKKN